LSQEEKLTKKAKILGDPEVHRWYDNLYRSSPNVAEVAIRRLNRFEELSKLTHDQLIKLEQRSLENIVQDAIRDLEKEDYAPEYIEGILKAVKSWLKHNDRELKRDIKIKDSGVPKTLEEKEEKVPEPQQLDNILAAASIRGKVSSSFMAFTGVRPEVLGNMEGTNGLMLSDLPELDINTLQFSSIPAQVIVRREISKVKHQYFSFLNQKGCNYLLDYLKYRVKEEKEELKANSPVVKADTNKKDAMLKHYGTIREGYFVCTRNVEDEIRRAIRRAGYNWRPYILRSYFDSHLLEAELSGAMGADSRSFFMGHKGTIERRYTLNKHKLPRELMRLMREQYIRGTEYLVAEQITRESIEDKLEKAKEETRIQLTAQFNQKMEELKARPEDQLRPYEMMATVQYGGFQHLYKNKMAELGRELTIDDKISAIMEAFAHSAGKDEGKRAELMPEEARQLIKK
jgi:hypothetical protein